MKSCKTVIAMFSQMHTQHSPLVDHQYRLTAHTFFMVHSHQGSQWTHLHAAILLSLLKHFDLHFDQRTI